MGFVTNDPKKGDEQQPGASGLFEDLGLMACPSCRREVPEWSRDCPDCGVTAVPRSALASAAPDVPAHLLAALETDDEQDVDAQGEDEQGPEDQATEDEDAAER